MKHGLENVWKYSIEKGPEMDKAYNFLCRNQKYPKNIFRGQYIKEGFQYKKHGLQCCTTHLSKYSYKIILTSAWSH